MKLHILGCYAATPRTFTNPTAQILELGNRPFLIDCGEGTQVQLRKSKIKYSRINHIFISHLHGDHFFGLPGLVSTFRLLGRTKELHIYGPTGIKEGITLLMKLGDSWTNYPLVFHELDSKEPQRIFEDDRVTVDTVPLDHRVYTNGFLFREKPLERHLNMEAIEKFGVDRSQYRNLKLGKDVVLPNGHILSNAQLTLDPRPPKSYAFCSDTVFDPGIVPRISKVDVLYHESTFLEPEAGLAAKTKHSTALQAAIIAKEAQVGTLVLGHYSTRYPSIQAFRAEALTEFPNVELAEDGKIFEF